MPFKSETIGEALWHLMGSNVDLIAEATDGALDREMSLDAIRAGHEAVSLLRYLISYEDQPCRYDHHGYCQEHPGGFRWLDEEDRPECMVLAARRVVSRRDAVT